MSAESENQIIQEIRAGNKSKLEEVYTAYRDEFFKWSIKNHQLNEEDAKEIYQLTMLIFYENIIQDKLTEIKSSLKSYIFQIGKYKIYDKNRKKENAVSPVDSYILNLPEDADLNEKEEKEIRLEKISNGMKILGQPCASILEMFYYLSRSMEEIATEFNYKNVATAKNQKYKCLKRLIKIVEIEG